MRKIERKCLECPVVMHITPKQKQYKEFCSVACWYRFNHEFLWKPCKLCRTEFLHKRGTPAYCDTLCFRLSLYKVFFPNSYEDNVKPDRKHWEEYCMSRNTDYKTPEEVPQFVW